MARPGINYDEVKDAANHLLANGISPSIQRIRAILGTGSNSTISEHLKRWQQEIHDKPRTVLPPTIPEAVMTALEAFWQVAVQQADALYQKQREQALETVQSAEQAREDALAALQQAQNETDQVHEQLIDLQKTSKRQENELLVEQERRHAAERTIALAEQRVVKAEQAAAQVRTDTHSRLAELESLLRQTREEARQQLAKAEQQLQIERERGEASETRLLQLIDQIRTEKTAEQRAHIKERTTWKTQEAAMKTQWEALQKELSIAQANLISAWDRVQFHQSELTQIRADLTKQQRQHVEAHCLVDSLRSELQSVMREKEKLVHELAKLREHSDGNQATAHHSIEDDYAGKKPAEND